MDINQIQNKLTEYFDQKDEIEFAYLFGSLARGEETPLSDVDIALFISEKEGIEDTDKYPYGYKAHITADIMGLLKKNDVDVVILNDAGALLRHRVVYGGEIIYNRNEKKRVEFQTRTLDEYMDYQYLQKSLE